MEIGYYRKNVYGNELMYIEDAYIAAKLGRLVGTKTICKEQMASISELFGVEWNEVVAPRV